MKNITEFPTPANETTRKGGSVPESIFPNEGTPSRHRLNHNFLSPLVAIPDGFESDPRFFPAVIFDFSQKFMCIQRMGVDEPGDRVRYATLTHQEADSTCTLRRSSDGKPLSFEEVANQYINEFISAVVSMPYQYCVNPDAQAMVAIDILPHAATKIIYGKDQVAYIEIGILMSKPKPGQTNIVDRIAYVPVDMNGLPYNHEDGEGDPEFDKFLIRIERLLFGVFTVLLTRRRAVENKGDQITKIPESEMPEGHIHHVIRQLWSVHAKQGEVVK